MNAISVDVDDAPVAAARVLAAWSLALYRRGLSTEVEAAVGALLLDYLGNAIGGSASDSARAAQRFVVLQHSSGPATAWGEGRQPAQLAALANGVAAHSLEMDDTHQPGSLHPGVTVFSAALAALDVASSDIEATDRFMPAVVAGYEITCRVGIALDPTAHYARGFHPTATAGVFGAALAAGIILGLDEDHLVNALGIAGSTAGGLMEFLCDGTWTKRLHPGWAAHSGMIAAQLAQSGFTGPATVFEGRNGFLHAYAAPVAAGSLTDCLGDDLQIRRTSIKAHACCRYMQAPIDGILQIMRSSGLCAEEVEQVTIGMLSTGWEIVVAPELQKCEPRTVVDAQFSMPFGAAVALLFGSASPAEFTPALLHDQAVQDMMRRVGCVRDAELDREFPRRWPATVVVRTRAGQCHTVRIDFPKGDPENPLTADELATKFRLLTDDVLTVIEQERVIDAVAGLGEAGGVTRLSSELAVLNERLSALSLP